MPQPSNRLVLEAEVRVIRVMLLTVSSVWLGSGTLVSDDRAFVLLPLTVAIETHIITVATRHLCLLLLQIILRLRRVQIIASGGNGRDRR